MNAIAAVNLWHWWQEACAGRLGPMHEGQPEQGYYRTRFKDGQWEPVALWFEGGEWKAMRGERMVEPGDAWNFCRTHPISYEAYQKAIDGAGWDDEPPAPAMGHNLPTDPFEPPPGGIRGRKGTGRGVYEDADQNSGRGR